jgi:hypothetical protein
MLVFFDPFFEDNPYSPEMLPPRKNNPVLNSARRGGNVEEIVGALICVAFNIDAGAAFLPHAAPVANSVKNPRPWRGYPAPPLVCAFRAIRRMKAGSRKGHSGKVRNSAKFSRHIG